MVKYSYFSARSGAREKNTGWRLDYFVIDDPHKEAIVFSDIDNTIFGSDHTPVEIRLDVARL
jgi:exonuclease III